MLNTRDQILYAVRADRAFFEARGVKSLYLFGSGARDELRPDSDVDFFFDFDSVDNLNFDNYMRGREKLAVITGRPIMFSTRRSLRPYVRETAEQDAVQVF
jgi:predicted nucleotidyltransferase